MGDGVSVYLLMVGARHGMIEGNPSNTPAMKCRIVSLTESIPSPPGFENKLSPVLMSARLKWMWPEHPGRSW